MRILVTGSSGFIGSHLVKYLNDDGHSVIPWDSKIGLDIRDIKSVDEFDFVIHLAAFADVRRSIEHPQEYWDNNVTPTTALQKLCYDQSVPLLYASSSCVTSWHKSPYGLSKKVNEETARPGQVGLRFTTVYGPRCRESMFIPKLITGSLEYATDHIRDFIYVSDVVRAIVLLMYKMNAGYERLDPYYDVGTGKGNKVCDIARIRMNVKVKPGNDCEALDNTADITPLKKFGWSPKVDVKEYVDDPICLNDFPKSIYFDLDALYNDIEKNN